MEILSAFSFSFLPVPMESSKAKSMVHSGLCNANTQQTTVLSISAARSRIKQLTNQLSSNTLCPLYQYAKSLQLPHLLKTYFNCSQCNFFATVIS